MDLTKNINIALNETQLLLDFVLLLLSLVRQLEKTSISPHLQKNVPLGSLSSDRLVVNKDDGAANAKGEQVGRRWKLESLQQVTKLFHHSHEELSQQMTKERRYWSLVNVVKSSGEVMFKSRDPELLARTIGVKYGYGDSGLSYYDKGLAILRKNDEGEVKFTPVTSLNRAIEKNYRYVRVRILTNIDGIFSLTGQLTFKYPDRRPDEAELTYDIDMARYFLFEEDLFYQLTREAKSLINYNVSIISDKIILEINNEIIEIELVSYDNDDDLDYQNINQFSTLNNQKCHKILVCLKIMLCCYYKYNLLLKQKMPTQLTKWKLNHSHPLILRPLLGNIRHELNLNRTLTIVHEKLDQYKPEIEVDKYVNLDADRVRVVGDNPFQKLVERPRLMVTAIVSSPNETALMKVAIEITANEIFVNLVLNMTITKFPDAELLAQNLRGQNLLTMSFHDFNDIGDCLQWTTDQFINE